MFARRALKPYLAEFLGTALLIVLGDGVVAQCLLSDYQYGTWLSINIAWASAVCLSGYLSDPGPTINPAVTICTALVRPSAGQWKTIPGKLAAQFLGGFVGAAIVYINYRSAIKAWDPEYTIPWGSILSPSGHHSAGIFSTYPSAFFESNWEAVFAEVLGSAVLMFGCLSISDPGNAQRFPAPQLSMFLLLLSIGAALGWQTGYVCSICYFVLVEANDIRLLILLEILVPDCSLLSSMAVKSLRRLATISWFPSSLQLLAALLAR
jgi:glycerol uptake facilitator-like aquaporin